MTLGVIPPRKRWYKKVRYWLLALVVLLVLFLAAARLLLHPIVQFVTSTGMSRLRGYQGEYKDVSFSLTRFQYVMNELKLFATKSDNAGLPLMEVAKVEISISWRKLLKGKLVTTLVMEKPTFNLSLRPDAPKEDQPRRPTTDIAVALREVMPFEVERLEIREGTMHIIDQGPPEGGKEDEKEKTGVSFDPRAEQVPEILVQGIEATMENIRTRTYLGVNRPTTLAVRATVQTTGTFDLFITADLLAEKLTFSGQTKLRGLDLTELNPMIAKETGLKVTHGAFDLFAAFTARNGFIMGGVKPLLQNAEIEKASPGIFDRLKALFVDTAISLFSNRVPGQNALGAVIPIEGKITDPNAQLLPTVLSVVRNAFVEGLISSLQGVPPPQAKMPQGPIEQTQRAIAPRPEGGQPLAQPEMQGLEATPRGPSVPEGNNPPEGRHTP